MAVKKRVVIIGGGLSGLSAAHYFNKAGYSVEVYEARDQAGGLVQTHATPWGIVETAANGFMNSTEVEEIFRAAGVPLLPARKEARRRFIIRGGRARRWPLNTIETVRFIIQIIINLFYFIFCRNRLRPQALESVAAYGARLLGSEQASRYTLETALSGIYAGDTKRMSASLIFSKYFGREKGKKGKNGKPKPQSRPNLQPSKVQVRGLVSAPGGMGSLVKNLTAALEKRGVVFHFQRQVKSLAPFMAQSTTESRAEEYASETSIVVLATSCADAAELLRDVDPARSEALRNVEMLPLITVTLQWKAKDALGLVGFGGLFARGEADLVLGVLLNDQIFAKRVVSSDFVSETWILGGAQVTAETEGGIGRDRFIHMTDNEVLTYVEAARRLLEQKQKPSESSIAASPQAVTITRWPQALPHLSLQMEKLAPAFKQKNSNGTNIHLLGNYTGGIGLPQIFKQASELPERIKSSTPPQHLGVMLINLGTPDEPTTEGVRRYLGEFLMDGRVLTMPRLIRWLLLRGIILPRRSPVSAKNYQKIWLKGKGSPLFVYSKELTENVQAALQTEDFLKRLQNHNIQNINVKLGMRYGNPSLMSVMQEFQKEGVDEILLAPLYPQWAESTTLSVYEEINRIARTIDFPLERISTWGDEFVEDPGLIRAWAEQIRPFLDRTDHLLFSYHGLPIRHIKKADIVERNSSRLEEILSCDASASPPPSASCNSLCLQADNCCAIWSQHNRYCYRAQCLRTSELLLKELGWDPNRASTTFQSRLGPTKWLTPATDQHIQELAHKHSVRRLTVVTPSFVVDGLESLEEIGMSGKNNFLAAGGKEFYLVSCPNTDPRWVAERIAAELVP